MSRGADPGEEPSEPSRVGAAPQPVSLQDPAAYREFVQSLFQKLQPRLASHLDSDLQVEIARLTRLLSAMPRRAVEENRELFELAYGLVAADKPNLVLIRSLAADLIAIHQRSVGGIARLLLPVCGRTALNAVLSALATIVAMSGVVMLVLGGSARFLRLAANGMAADSGLLTIVQGGAFPQLLLMMHAAFLGSFVSIVVRMNTYLTASTMTPLMIYISVVARPLVSVLFSMLVFSTLKSGLISVYGLNLDGPHGSYLAWAIGFLCGFSERLAQDFVGDASRTLGDPAAAMPPSAPPPS